ncbi:MAG TPA: ComEC/Rec2 family competence protein [Saprospiraceae bacterium]|nr:ComEC/Rec2 family competence protein [Saprospiraceae bacterium]HNT19794.1 ComEC/Rec2 family competence protein [Saprospiraceae bacterium]
MRILIPFALGILCSNRTTGSLLLGLAVLVPSLLAMIGAHRRAKRQVMPAPWFGLASLGAWWALGFAWAALRDDRTLPNHFFDPEKQYQELVVEIHQVDEKERYWNGYSRTFLEIGDSINRNVHGNLLIRIPKPGSYNPSSGDVIQARFRIQEPFKPSFPFEFDWNLFLHRRNIHHFTYLDTADFRVVHHPGPGLLESLRARLDGYIREAVPSDRDYPVASAMLLGSYKKMDQDLFNAYSATGAVHILAVSGLHVGIMAHIFQYLFGFIRIGKKKPVQLQALLLIGIIWAYALLTGAAPAILRAALMFSFLTVSRLLLRDSSPVNILAAAAFVLLCINPFDIYNIGFQLSFLAMAGLFLLYEPFRTLITVENRIVQVLVKVIAASCAAQLAIYPVVGFHFHQFAFYFWLTGLISTPFSYLILGGGLFTLALWPLAGHLVPWISIPFRYGVLWMNETVSWIYTLPLGKIQGWWPSLADTLFLILLSGGMAYVHFQKTRFSFNCMLLCGILFLSVLILEEKRNQTKTELVAGTHKNRPWLWIKHRENAFLYLIQDSMKIPRSYLEKYKLREENIIYFHPGKQSLLSGPLRLEGNQIIFGEKHFEIALEDQKTKSEYSKFQPLLKNRPAATPSITTQKKPGLPDLISFAADLKDGPSPRPVESPYLRIRIK